MQGALCPRTELLLTRWQTRDLLLQVLVPEAFAVCAPVVAEMVPVNYIDLQLFVYSAQLHLLMGL
jgi:hypothetical protein